jgi:hypothetical protein
LRRRLQSAPATNEGTPARERMAVEREFIRSRWIGVNCLIFGTLALYELVFFTAPPVYGQLLELQTGKPIAGARVTRHLSQVGPWRIFEGPAAAPVVFSTHEVHSDSQGRFALPGWINLVPLGVQGLSGMSWVVFASGWMPAYGCVGRGFHPLGAGWIDCGAFGSPSTVDPWVQSAVGGFVGFTTMRIRISRPTVEGVTFGGRDSSGRFIPAPGPRKGIDDDPWGEYFRRLNILVQYRYVKRDEFVQQAVEYVRRSGPLSDEIALQFLELVGAPILERPIPHDRNPQVLLLRKAIVGYCDQTPESDFCRRYAVGLGYIRQFFLQKDTSAR